MTDPPPAAVPHPESIGPYRILERVGHGGMGEVFLAQALASLDHPNIAKVFDAGATEQGRPYFTLEFIRGEPVTRFCDRHDLSLDKRLALFDEICRAVEHAHERGIIHRDLKPGNVLVHYQDGQPAVKVIDFGIAKATNQRLTESTYCTEVGQILGTPEYMSPEQAEMSSLDVDHRSDVYSLGVILYELLSGALPFTPRSCARRVSSSCNAGSARNCRRRRASGSLRRIASRHSRRSYASSARGWTGSS
jgi:serine/threonine protein kinase